MNPKWWAKKDSKGYLQYTYLSLVKTQEKKFVDFEKVVPQGLYLFAKETDVTYICTGENNR